MTTSPILYAISVSISQDLAQALELMIEDQEASSWSIHEQYNTSGAVEAYALKGFFESQDTAEEAFEALRLEFTGLPEAVKIEPLEPKVWQEAYKEYLQPWNYGNLHWVPEWRSADYPIPEGELVVQLNPGMAFGTGSHETTRLLAQRLVDWGPHFPEKSATLRVIDAGCGSGILALTAYQLGLKHIQGFDIDPEAVRISQEHLALNHLPLDSISFFTANLQEGLAKGPWDVIIANIQTDVLLPHATILLQSLAPGGVLLLSGILIKERSLMFEALEKAAKDLRLPSPELHSQQLGDWCDVVATVY